MRLAAIVVLALAVLISFSVIARADGTMTLVYPEALVKQDGGVVVNGCGPDFLQITSADRRFANRHTYKFEVAYGEYASYTVDFQASCNLHDAGYQGRFWAYVDGQWVSQPLVYDRILNQTIDYSTKSRQWIDEHFLADMRAQCEQQINQQGDPRGRAQALAYCKGRGPLDGWGGWGAEVLFKLVREHGDSAFNDPDGQWRVNDRR